MRSQLNIISKLMRLDRPIGFYLLVWPCLWSLWYCTQGQPDLTLLIWLLLGTVLARSAGCVINDIVDADIDDKVARTKTRPLAMGLCTKRQAFGLFLLLLSLSAALAFYLDIWWSATIAAVLMSLYPFFKRFFMAPQVWLGLTWGWSVFVVWDAVKIPFTGSLFWLFGVTLFWTLAFDTLYAITDRAFDRKLNLHSLAILLDSHDLFGIGVCYVLMLGCWFGFALTLANSFYALAGMPLAMIFIGLIIYYCRSRDELRCFRAFQANHWLGAYFWLLLVLTFWQHPA